MELETQEGAIGRFAQSPEDILLVTKAYFLCYDTYQGDPYSLSRCNRWSDERFHWICCETLETTCMSTSLNVHRITKKLDMRAKSRLQTYSSSVDI